MEKPLISVIIPFYKGEKYIKQAVSSVLSQPYKNLELLLINDGSPTGSAECEVLKDTDDRIKYYSKTNEGIGATRNFGIEHANGEYLAFLDQDDIWVKNFLTEETVERIVNGGDIIGFSHYACNNNFSRGNIVRVKNETISGGGEAAQSCPNHHSSLFTKSSLLGNKDIRYALSRQEDVIYIQRALYVADKITYIDKPMFLYRNNNS